MLTNVVATEAETHSSRRPLARHDPTKSSPDPHLNNLEPHPKPPDPRHRYHTDLGLQVPTLFASASRSLFTLEHGK
jgi:hypothetical protein